MALRQRFADEDEAYDAMLEAARNAGVDVEDDDALEAWRENW